jgi:hypothetical protein
MQLAGFSTKDQESEFEMMPLEVIFKDLHDTKAKLIIPLNTEEKKEDSV